MTLLQAGLSYLSDDPVEPVGSDLVDGSDGSVGSDLVDGDDRSERSDGSDLLDGSSQLGSWAELSLPDSPEPVAWEPCASVVLDPSPEESLEPPWPGGQGVAFVHARATGTLDIAGAAQTPIPMAARAPPPLMSKSRRLIDRPVRSTAGDPFSEFSTMLTSRVQRWTTHSAGDHAPGIASQQGNAGRPGGSHCWRSLPERYVIVSKRSVNPDEPSGPDRPARSIAGLSGPERAARHLHSGAGPYG